MLGSSLFLSLNSNSSVSSSSGDNGNTCKGLTDPEKKEGEKALSISNFPADKGILTMEKVPEETFAINRADKAEIEDLKKTIKELKGLLKSREKDHSQDIAVCKAAYELKVKEFEVNQEEMEKHISNYISQILANHHEIQDMKEQNTALKLQLDSISAAYKQNREFSRRLMEKNKDLEKHIANNNSKVYNNNNSNYNEILSFSFDEELSSLSHTSPSHSQSPPAAFSQTQSSGILLSSKLGFLQKSEQQKQKSMQVKGNETQIMQDDKNNDDNTLLQSVPEMKGRKKITFGSVLHHEINAKIESQNLNSTLTPIAMSAPSSDVSTTNNNTSSVEIVSKDGFSILKKGNNVKYRLDYDIIEQLNVQEENSEKQKDFADETKEKEDLLQYNADQNSPRDNILNKENDQEDNVKRYKKGSEGNPIPIPQEQRSETRIVEQPITIDDSPTKALNIIQTYFHNEELFNNNNNETSVSIQIPSALEIEEEKDKQNHTLTNNQIHPDTRMQGQQHGDMIYTNNSTNVRQQLVSRILGLESQLNKANEEICTLKEVSSSLKEDISKTNLSLEKSRRQCFNFLKRLLLYKEIENYHIQLNTINEKQNQDLMFKVEQLQLQRKKTTKKKKIEIMKENPVDLSKKEKESDNNASLINPVSISTGKSKSKTKSVEGSEKLSFSTADENSEQPKEFTSDKTGKENLTTAFSLFSNYIKSNESNDSVATLTSNNIQANTVTALKESTSDGEFSSTRQQLSPTSMFTIPSFETFLLNSGEDSKSLKKDAEDFSLDSNQERKTETTDLNLFSSLISTATSTRKHPKTNKENPAKPIKNSSSILYSFENFVEKLEQEGDLLLNHQDCSSPSASQRKRKQSPFFGRKSTENENHALYQEKTSYNALTVEEMIDSLDDFHQFIAQNCTKDMRLDA